LICKKHHRLKKSKSIKKLDDLLILTQYTERVYSGQTAKIDIKICDINQNKSKNFSQNYGQIEDVNIRIKWIDEFIFRRNYK
jgi:hypothetical protein